MKSITTYINEKLIVNKNTRAKKYNYYPETKEELQDILKELIKERGNEGDFNDIDTSEITDMSKLFYDMISIVDSYNNFNGDISGWDVSKVTNMQGMFSHCKYFNKDLSKWNVSNVKNMNGMFFYCENFNQPLNKWDVSKVKNMNQMFMKCYKFNQDISNWNVSNVTETGNYLDNIFTCCEIEEKYKPKFK